MNKQELETKALELIKSGKTQTEIEALLKTEFIFFKTPFDNEYKSATYWKAIN